MNVSLTKELDNFVKGKLQTGLYSSASEVVREGLRLLQEHEQLRAVKLKVLKQEINQGLKDAKAKRKSKLDVDDIKLRGRQKLRGKKRA